MFVLNLCTLEGVDALLGLHVWSQLPSGKVNFSDGPRMACSDRFIITASGAEDATVTAAAAVVLALQQFAAREIPHSPFVLTVGRLNSLAGVADPSAQVEIVGTARTFDRALRARLPQMLEQAAAGTAQVYGCTAGCEYRFGPSAVINEHTELNELARGAARTAMGRTRSCLLPCRWAEKILPSLPRTPLPCSASSGSGTRRRGASARTIRPISEWTRTCCTGALASTRSSRSIS